MQIDIAELIEKGGDDVNIKNIVKIMSKAIKNEWDPFTVAMLVYREIFGNTLCKDFCNYMVEHMNHGENSGRKWTVEQTNELAKKNGIEFDSDYTEYEFNAVVHLMWHIYHDDIKDSGISSDNIYAKMADSYFTNPNSPKGKLVNYFFFLFRD